MPDDPPPSPVLTAEERRRRLEEGLRALAGVDEPPTVQIDEPFVMGPSEPAGFDFTEDEAMGPPPVEDPAAPPPRPAEVGTEGATVFGGPSDDADLESMMTAAAPRSMDDVLSEGARLDTSHDITDDEWQGMLSAERQAMGAPQPTREPPVDALRALTGEEPRPWSPDADLEEAQAKDRRRGAFSALLRALGAAGVGIAAAKGRPEFMPLASAIGGGIGGVIDSTRGQARDVMQQQESAVQQDEAQFRRERMEQDRVQSEQSARFNEARLAMEKDRLGLAVTREEREAAQALSEAERANLEQEVEMALHDPGSELSRTEQEATIASLNEIRAQASAPELTEEEAERIRRMPAASLRDPRGPVARAFGVSEQALKTRRAEIMGQQRAEAEMGQRRWQVQTEQRREDMVRAREEREQRREREEEARQTRTVGDPAYGSVVVPGSLDPATRTKVTGVIDARDKFLALSDRLMEAFSVMRDNPQGVVSEAYRNAAADAEATHAAMKIEYKNIAELGALSGPDMDLVLGAIGDAPSYSSVVADQLGLSTWERRLNTASTIAAEQAMRIARNNGAQAPGTQQAGRRPANPSSAEDAAGAQPQGSGENPRQYRIFDEDGHEVVGWRSIPSGVDESVIRSRLRSGHSAVFR